MNYVNLNSGTAMPILGYGVYNIENSSTGADIVKTAISAGYRSIDTAAGYNNEEAIGQAIKECGLPREEIFLTTKLGNPDQRSGKIEEAFAQSLANLQLDYVDLYLIHWPAPGHYVDAWLALEKIYKSGRAKAIGVSNYQPRHLDDLSRVWSVVPAVNQFEMHPRLTQKPLIAHCKKYGIAPQSWSPLGGSKPENKETLLENPVLKGIAEKYGKTVAQVILRWNVDLGVICIPKSATPSRIRENIDVFDFTLTPDEIAAIDALNQDVRFGPDPDNFDF